MESEWTKLGEVGVDSGSLMIGDPCYLTNDWDNEMYDRDVCSEWDLFKQLKGDNGYLKAVLFSSGLGDGVYEVFGKIKKCGDWGDRMTEVKIVLIEDNHTD